MFHERFTVDVIFRPYELCLFMVARMTRNGHGCANSYYIWSTENYIAQQGRRWAGGSRGPDPSSPDQGHLWESPRSDEFLWTGGVGVVPWHVCQWPSDSTPVSPQRTGSRHDIINNTVFFIFLSLPLSIH